jgi:adenosylcobinamide-phosphate synthase
MDLVIMAAVAVDLLIGDPRWLPHPVVGMGWVIKQGEIFIRRRARTKLALKWSGAVLTALVVAGSYFFFWGLINLAGAIHPVAGLLVGIFFMSQALAVKGLYQHARAVVQPLARNDLPAARQALGRIVGRDTADLDEQEVIRGTVESVAENTVDGIAAPLFYGFLGGPPLALAYKAVNTLDSMIGYRDERYIDLGWRQPGWMIWSIICPPESADLFFCLLLL